MLCMNGCRYIIKYYIVRLKERNPLTKETHQRIVKRAGRYPEPRNTILNEEDVNDCTNGGRNVSGWKARKKAFVCAARRRRVKEKYIFSWRFSLVCRRKKGRLPSCVPDILMRHVNRCSISAG